VALAARDLALDIAGAMFVLGGEPLTDARRRLIAAAGCTAIAHYSMGEVGRVGKHCCEASAADDVHLLEDKIAMIRRPHAMPDGTVVRANHYTTLSSATAKLLINVESGDHSAVERRPCGCPFGRAGLNTHLHSIRSYEKLTSEGMNFLGSDLLRLIDEVLPARFGGAPTDYQFVEREDEQGLPRVDLRISHRVTLANETDARDLVLTSLNGGRARGYGDRWREASTLTVVRGEPLETGAAKILALHSLRKQPERQTG
jgi:phenylacetate-coenzyme A ligase PaaK-like adenylate-forming protein